MRARAAAMMFVAACSAPSDATIGPPAAATTNPAPASPPASSALVDPCADTAIRFEVTPPVSGAPTATFAFRWKGDGHGSSAKTVCLVRGAEVERVPRGERREVAIRADARALQRIVVGKRPHLIAVPPGAAITLGDNPCFFYELSGPTTDPWFAPKPIAYCARNGEDCRAGYFRPDPPRPVDDELCGDTRVIQLGRHPDGGAQEADHLSSAVPASVPPSRPATSPPRQSPPLGPPVANGLHS